MVNEPTPRQLEVLQALHGYKEKHGVFPTFRELKKLLGLSSNQAIDDLFKQLESKGFITTSSKVRGTRLTLEALRVLGLADKTEPSIKDQTVYSRPPFELTGAKEPIFKRLTDIDPLLGRIYLGGLIMCEERTNPDWIALSAHAFRRVIENLRKKGQALVSSDEEKEMRGKASPNALRIKRYRDPRGGVTALSNTVYDEFYRTFFSEGFSPIAHDGVVPVKEYFALIADFERFLISYILPSQPEIYAKIDVLLKKKPADVEVKELQLLLTYSLESYQYFFKTAPDTWLQYLNENKLLSPTWAVGNYLARIASTAPKPVMDILVKYPIPSGNQELKNTFVLAAKNMPAEITARIIPRILSEKWMVADIQQMYLLQHYIGDLIEHLIKGGQYEAALKLSSHYFDVYKKETEREASPLVDDYQYGEALKSLSLLPVSEIPSYLEMLINKLRKVCEIEAENSRTDYSHIWLPAIEHHVQNWESHSPGVMLTRAIRDLLEKLVVAKKNSSTEIKENIQDLFSGEPLYPVLRRIRLHIYRVFPEVFKEEIAGEIIDAFHEDDVWHEYALLVQEHLNKVPSKTKKRFFELVDEGPKPKDTDPQYVKYWQARRIQIAEGHLSQAQKKKYGLLTEKKIEDADFLAPHHSWSGPNSPLTEEALSAMKISEIVKALVEWQPPKERMGPTPSRYGLALTLSAVVKRDPDRFLSAMDEFKNKALHPTYLQHLFYGLREGLKTNQNLKWFEVISLAEEIVSRLSSGELKMFEKTEDDEDTGRVAMPIISFIAAILGQDSVPEHAKYAPSLIALIETLCEHPDPTPEHEEKYGGDNMDPFTMSINTVRGEAFHALFTYMIWRNRLQRKKNSKSKLFVPDEIKKVVEKNLPNDKSVTVRSVYGKYLPWLVLYDKEWIQTLMETLLPEEERDLRYAAWETYMANTIYTDVFKFMYPYYLMAIRDLPGQVPNRQYWADVIENLSTHTVLGYIHGFDKEPIPLYEQYFERASAKQRGIAISHIGRSLVLKDEEQKGKKPDVRKLKKIWEARLKADTSTEELKEFGWWSKAGFFDDEWYVNQLLKTAEKTQGTLEGDHWIGIALSKIAHRFPVQSAKILNLLVRSENTRGHFTFVYENEITEILKSVFESKVPEAEKIGDMVVDYLTKMGFEKFRFIKKPKSNI
jgi:hypothetical protein